METQTFRIFKFILVPLLLATVLVLYYGQEIKHEWVMRVDFQDIGQGDSILITTYEGNQVLIDGGPGSKVLEELGSNMPFFDRTIEMIMLTHPHADHFEGLIPVLRRYEVKQVLLPNIEMSNSSYTEFMNEAEREGAEIIYAQQGQRIYLDKSTVFDVMWPQSNQKVTPGKNDDLNDYSIVGKLTFGKTKILFTGDSGINIEDQLLPKFNLDSDILKVGHHGSKHSTSQYFLDEVTPQYSVIQLGENKYGHPSKEVIERLKNSGTQILRNDEQGSIEFYSDGFTLKLSE